jgi:hypothetical protein
MRTFKFYKEADSRWYVDLPEWEGPKADLEMVAGADSFLEILAEGEGKVDVILSVTPFAGADTLTMSRLGRIEGWELGSGAWYDLNQYKSISFDGLEMWLCDVTKFVFGDFPKEIYFSKVEA